MMHRPGKSSIAKSIARAVKIGGRAFGRGQQLAGNARPLVTGVARRLASRGVKSIGGGPLADNIISSVLNLAVSGRGFVSPDRLVEMIVRTAVRQVVQHYEAEMQRQIASAMSRGVELGVAQERARALAAAATGPRIDEAAVGTRLADFLVTQTPAERAAADAGEESHASAIAARWQAGREAEVKKERARQLPGEIPLAATPEELGELVRSRGREMAARSQAQVEAAHAKAESLAGAPPFATPTTDVEPTGAGMVILHEHRVLHTFTTKAGKFCDTDRWFDTCGLVYDAALPKNAWGGMYNPNLFISGRGFRCYYPESTAAHFKSILNSSSSGRWLNSWHQKKAYIEF